MTDARILVLDLFDWILLIQKKNVDNKLDQLEPRFFWTCTQTSSLACFSDKKNLALNKIECWTVQHSLETLIVSSFLYFPPFLQQETRYTNKTGTAPNDTKLHMQAAARELCY